MENRVGRNEFVNQVLLKVEEGKVFLSKDGVRFHTSLDSVKIMNDSVSIMLSNTYIRLNSIISEIMVMDLEKNEIYVYEYGQDKANGDVKIEVLPDACHIMMKITEIKPISLESLMRILESLKIPHSSRYLNRFDIDVSKYNTVMYNSSDGLRLQSDSSDIWITKDTIIYNGLTVDISNHSYFISVEKGVMSIMF